MSYGIFNLASGNLIDSVTTEGEALALLSGLLDEKNVDLEQIGLVVADDNGRTLLSLHGHSLADAVYSGGITPSVYA
jgi:hypothetical protein